MLQPPPDTDVCKAKPFLRWTGSKSWLVKEHITKFLPKKFNDYHEPFLGGGAVFFHIRPQKNVYLSDLNSDLITTYVQIRDNVEKVIEALRLYRNTEEDYYQIRAMTNKTDHCKAARFIYLNRTSFNGIYRVNDKGQYNVPYGKREAVDILTADNLRSVSEILKGKNIFCESFTAIKKTVSKNDLVYLDPPYTVAHENNGFIEYNSKLFSWDDQHKLAELLNYLNKIGAQFILSNAEHLAIRKLFKGLGDFYSLSRYSKVGGRNKTRGVFNEVIITNIK
ncbi:MAG: Dam family site-specific DNA-(adenine-N6)-methyltransferase [Chitinophagales bacterium]|nr:Dam family site-specific DNA-(adenine-N6)-methyltransferase [Chitinophagales bacterium]